MCVCTMCVCVCMCVCMCVCVCMSIVCTCVISWPGLLCVYTHVMNMYTPHTLQVCVHSTCMLCTCQCKCHVDCCVITYCSCTPCFWLFSDLQVALFFLFSLFIQTPVSSFGFRSLGENHFQHACNTHTLSLSLSLSTH